MSVHAAMACALVAAAPPQAQKGIAEQSAPNRPPLRINDVGLAPDGASATLVLSELLGQEAVTVVWSGRTLKPEVDRNRVSVILPRGLAEAPGKIVVWRGSESTEPYTFKPPELAAQQRSLPWSWIAPLLAGFVVATAVAWYLGARRNAARLFIESPKGAIRGVIPVPDELSIAPAAPSVAEPQPFVPEPPEELLDALARGTVFLFAGAGVGRHSGYPIWRELLQGIAELHAKTEPGVWVGIVDLVRRNELTIAADLIGTRLPAGQLEQDLLAVFERQLPPSDVARAIANLPLAGVITNNWDHTLVAALTNRQPVVVTPATTEDVEGTVRSRAFLVVKLRGELRGGGFSFTSQAYRASLDANPTFQKLLGSIVASNSVFFVGTSVAGIEELMSTLPPRTPQSPIHFALVPKTSDAAVQQEYLASKYGVRAILFGPSADFREQEEFCRRLARRPVAAGLPAVVQRLESITLTSIGAFPSLSLTFNPGWNVVLGNNGCGKTTLLRAIALGLVGDDTRSSSGPRRLLSAKANSGAIDLRVGQNLFHTELHRPGPDGAVRVSTRQLTPLQAGNWVVLGYPPLRGVSTHDPKSQTAVGPAHPTVEDVLPLLDGGVDQRLDDLKQWIVNVDARSSSGGGISEENARRNRDLLDAFFSFLSELLPGIPFERVPVDRNTLVVCVRTGDGLIPIDALSQGMSSILGWLGTLLQRMYEIHGASEHPEREPALLLIDEIDAHLHPEWQQALIPLMKARFPALQVIATTHSPLVVAGMQAAEVFVARRDEKGVARIEQAPAGFEGLRYDQVLTSPLFGLSSTRSFDTRRDIDRYADLLGKERSEPEQSELVELKEKLAPILRVGETPLERTVETAVRSAVSSMVPGTLGEDVKMEIKRQLAELLPDSEPEP